MNYGEGLLRGMVMKLPAADFICVLPAGRGVCLVCQGQIVSKAI